MRIKKMKKNLFTKEDWKEMRGLFIDYCARNNNNCSQEDKTGHYKIDCWDCEERALSQIGIIKKSAIDEFTELLNNIQSITYFTGAPMYPNFHNIKRKELMDKFTAALNEAKEQSH